MRMPFLAALSLSILSLAAPKARAVAEPPLAITNVTVVDVVAGRELPDRTVVIRGDRIAAVVPAAHALPASARRIDGRGKWLIPGLWDMHMHALTDGRFSYFFPLLLANGVTGIREMGSNLPLDEIARIRRALDSGRMLGPRIGALSPRLLDGPGSNFPTAVVVSSPDEARATLRAFRKAGADFAKPYNLLSRPTYLAVVDEAKKLGMPVEGHVPFSMTALEVARLGQTTIEHDFDILLSASSDEHRLRAALQADPTHWLLNEGRAAVSYDPAKARVLYLQLARLGVWSCPTVAFYRVPILIGDQPDVRSDPRLAYVPAWQVKRWSAQLAQSARNLGASEDRPRHYAMRSRIVREMHLAGVRILAGTDSGAMFAVAGFTLHDELAALVDAGLTPLEALRSATIGPALFLHRTKIAGTIAPGREADLVLLDGDPLADIHNSARVRAVVTRGRPLDRTRLDELLDAARTAAARSPDPGPVQPPATPASFGIPSRALFSSTALLQPSRRSTRPPARR